MPTAKTIQDIKAILAADDAAAYKEGVEYGVTLPSNYEPALRKYMRLAGWREPVNYMLDAVKDKGQPTGYYEFFMIAWDREFLEVILTSAEKLVSIATEYGRARLRETMGD